MPSPSIVEAERQARCERAARKTLDFPEQDGVAAALLNVGRPQSAQWRARQTMTDMSPTEEVEPQLEPELTPDELSAQAQHLYAHADELRRYLRERSPPC
jgi:hypothetical protein